MNRVMIDKAVFALCDAASSKHTIHPGIGCVCIEQNIAVATDMSMLVAVDLKVKAADGWEPILLSAGELRKVGKALGKNKNAWMCAPDADGNVKIEADGKGREFSLVNQNLRFPDWRLPVRRAVRLDGGPVPRVAIDSSYIGTAGSIASACAGEEYGKPGRSLTYYFHGNSCVVLVSPWTDRFVAFLMPLRIEGGADMVASMRDLRSVYDRWLCESGDVKSEVA